MAGTRYPELCALARAAELVGERWTLLIARELRQAPRRFADLRARLDGLSASVLAERLGRLEAAGLVERRVLEPPAASTVYELTADGRALEPALLALTRWGMRFLLPPRPRERIDAEWLHLALQACARRTASPAVAVELKVRAGRTDVRLHVEGGPGGTRIADEVSRPPDVTVTAGARTALALVTGRLTPAAARRDRTVRIDGDAAALDHVPALFTLDADTAAAPKS
jgi:DNA-binding HxlR family transcriptional regulator